MNQKVSGWFGGVAERPTRATPPPAERVGLRYLLSDMRNVVTSCLRPLGRLTVRHALGGMGRDDGRSESHPVMGWIRVEGLRLNIIRSVRELTSIGRFFARKPIEPILEGKANEATYVSHAPFPEWVLAVSVYRKGDWSFRSLGRLYAEVGL